MDTLKAAVSSALREFNDAPFQKRSGSRTEIFLQEEKAALRELPALPYEIAEWIYGRKVYPDCHVTYNKNHYSCPYQYVGKQVDLKITGSFIEIFHKSERLATHNKYHDYVCNAWSTQSRMLKFMIYIIRIAGRSRPSIRTIHLPVYAQSFQRHLSRIYRIWQELFGLFYWTSGLQAKHQDEIYSNS